MLSIQGTGRCSSTTKTKAQFACWKTGNNLNILSDKKVCEMWQISDSLQAFKHKSRELEYFSEQLMVVSLLAAFFFASVTIHNIVSPVFVHLWHKVCLC